MKIYNLEVDWLNSARSELKIILESEEDDTALGDHELKGKLLIDQ
eukprot:CAMPEP_0114582208 /NCGR_PEP_ID=MMETSP0125-20121206/6236_1 /TAXON_ID=485358 ORGANISM="Aristerostoma sp., Strain ATCC 50986" /NCGR_SAMPLE_ID=MMETSP0125 /ASSEMBLY_ACC=CAM_ASM_000245 /LENGTH=44 /DNA_ID= /DNA_START= /DNA_END= /DNA_ORIENTATION=